MFQSYWTLTNFFGNNRTTVNLTRTSWCTFVGPKTMLKSITRANKKNLPAQTKKKMFPNRVFFSFALLSKYLFCWQVVYQLRPFFYDITTGLPVMLDSRNVRIDSSSNLKVIWKTPILCGIRFFYRFNISRHCNFKKY